MNMQKLVCDVCGGAIRMQEGGQFGICSCCGLEYTFERMKEIYSGMKVSVTGSDEDVAQWKQLVNTYLNNFDYQSAEQIVKKILEAVPSDRFANEIYRKLQCWKDLDVKNGVLLRYNGCCEEIDIPNGIKVLRSGAFSHKKELKAVNIPDTVEKIEMCCFEYCCNLQKIRMGNGIKNIEKNAFAYCGIKEIKIPESVTEIEPGSLACPSLISINWRARRDLLKYDLFYDDARSNAPCCIADNVTIIIDGMQEKLTTTINRKNGKCLYCGGSFKNSIFGLKCMYCGRKKDY